MVSRLDIKSIRIYSETPTSKDPLRQRRKLNWLELMRRGTQQPEVLLEPVESETRLAQFDPEDPPPTDTPVDQEPPLDDMPPTSDEATIAESPSAWLSAPPTPPLAPKRLSLPETGPIAYLVSRLTQLCNDPAIHSAGHWEMQIPLLKPELLPNTALFLSLSYFALSLRFEIADLATKELICLYCEPLKHRLTELMAKRTPAREVNIVIW
ncbi:type III secretion system protein SctP [Mycoavidus sp. B2-EB]|uniref:type III secretion system protein SctP n=1 Tax=Mycoavidus sp. B2-EB TaxID=2651972 RepID=UPI001629E206|nr:type III secretion system protein SctP [Mycoavidus sp. B2-EB]BBO59492.1 type III secretion protein HpaP [Mycoavidus sp. B2-EB]